MRIPTEIYVASLSLIGGIIIGFLNRKPAKSTVSEIYSRLHEDLLEDLTSRKQEVQDLREELNDVRVELREVKMLLKAAVNQMRAAGLSTDGFNV